MSSFKCLVPLAILVLLGAASAKPHGLAGKIIKNHLNSDSSTFDQFNKCAYDIEHPTRTCAYGFDGTTDNERYFNQGGFGGHPVYNGQWGYGGNYGNNGQGGYGGNYGNNGQGRHGGDYVHNGQRDFIYGGRAFNVGSGATSQRTAEANAKAQSAGSSEANATATAAASADGNTQAAGNVNALGGGSDPNFNQPGYNDGSGAQETIETTTNARTGDLGSGQAHAQASAQAN